MAEEMKTLKVDASNGSFIFEVVDAEAREMARAAMEAARGNSNLRVSEISLLAANWQGKASPYSQVVDIDGVTEWSQVDLTPSVVQLAIFHDKDLAFVTENEGGVVTVYAIGQKPENDYTMQVTIKEVSV